MIYIDIEPFRKDNICVAYDYHIVIVDNYNMREKSNLCVAYAYYIVYCW